MLRLDLKIILMLKYLTSLFVARQVGSTEPIGPQGHVGTKVNPIKVERLVINKPGLYENYLIDSRWQGGNRVKVSCDDVVIRNCEIRNASGNGIGVFGRNVVIENCRIHTSSAALSTNKEMPMESPDGGQISPSGTATLAWSPATASSSIPIVDRRGG